MKKTVKINESTLRKIISESIKKVLKEGQYSAYVLVDQASEAVLGNYDGDDLENAIEDAKEKGAKGGRYLVIGCDDNGYGFNDVVFDTNPGVSYKF